MRRKSRSLGQNFLINRHIAHRIACSIPEQSSKYLLEIGPGKGILTEELLKRGGQVLSIEIDRTMGPFLEPLLRSYPERFGLIWGNALEHLDKMFREPTFLVSNLPFSISTSLFYGICERLPFEKMTVTPFLGGTVMVQEEFARRLLSRPGSKEYGKLSVLFCSKMETASLFRVSKGNFDPVPEVDAAVISFRPKRYLKRTPLNEMMFNMVVETSFLNRRKKLRNSLYPGSLGLNVQKDVVVNILRDLGYSDSRPEQVDYEGFIQISDALANI